MSWACPWDRKWRFVRNAFWVGYGWVTKSCAKEEIGVVCLPQKRRRALVHL